MAKVKINQCEYCGHRQEDHTGGRGYCNYVLGITHFPTCRCERFKRVTGTIDKDFQDWKREHESA